MELFGLFKSEEEKFRSKVRACFDESVDKLFKEKGDAVKNPLFGGLLIKTAIGAVYQSMINDPGLHLLALKLNFDPIKIVEEECNRALSKYLE